VPKENNECICRVVRDAARALTNAYDRALAPSGLRTTQFTMLSVLDRREVAIVTELSELLEIDQTTTTRNLSVLEDSGLVVRVEHEDPRVKLMKLSSKGRQKRQIAVKCWKQIQNDITSSVSKTEWKTFRRVLETIENQCRGEQS